MKLEDITNRVFCGDSLSVLKTFPDKSIDMCITSPPYYGLRSYSTSPVVWGGGKNCKHSFNMSVINKKTNYNEGFNERWGNSPGIKSQETKSHVSQEVGYCSFCGAWKGELGAEPTVSLYINHMITIFDEVRRCLKDSGSLWVNLGDSYMPHNGTRGNKTKAGSDTLRGNDDLEAVAPKRKCIDTIPSKSLMLVPERFVIAMVDQRNEECELRDDLSEEERVYVLTELARRGIL